MPHPCKACGTITSDPLGFCSSQCHDEYQQWIAEYDAARLSQPMPILAHLTEDDLDWVENNLVEYVEADIPW